MWQNSLCLKRFSACRRITTVYDSKFISSPAFQLLMGNKKHRYEWSTQILKKTNLSFLEYRWQKCHEDFVKYALEYYNINMGNKTRIFMYYLPQGMTLLKLSRVLKCRPEELLAYVDCLWKITYWKYLPLIVQCNCYMTDGNSGVYHVKYNKRMPTVWAKSPDVRFFLFLG